MMRYEFFKAGGDEESDPDSIDFTGEDCREQLAAHLDVHNLRFVHIGRDEYRVVNELDMKTLLGVVYITREV